MGYFEIFLVRKSFLDAKSTLNFNTNQEAICLTRIEFDGESLQRANNTPLCFESIL